MISPFDKCLFIHVPKVAGQSIEQLFLQRAGLNWQQREQFLLKHNQQPALGPPRLAHLTYREYVELGYLSTEQRNELFSFAFVRNPWSRLVSEYLYRDYRCSFKDFVLKHFPRVSDDDYTKGFDGYRHVMPQADFLIDEHGKLAVDFIGRFENLADDFSTLTTQLVGESLRLPHRNKTEIKGLSKLISRLKPKTAKPHYREYYDRETRDAVAQLYKTDIELFKYDF